MSEFINNVEFIDLEDKDLVFINCDLLGTIDYDGDFEVESVRKNVRKLFNNLCGVEG